MRNMADVRTDLKEAKRETHTLGILSEKKLEIENDEKGEAKLIKGTLTLQTSPENFTTYNVYTNRLTKAGTENKAFKGLVTVMEEYKSIAEVGKEEATVVNVNGKVDPNSFAGEQGVVERMRFSSNFFNRYNVKEDEEVEYESTFTVELYIKAIRPEVCTQGENQGGETGRVSVDGQLALYGGGIEPVQLIAPEEDGIADAIADMFEPGQTVLFDGNIENTRIETIKEIPMAIGKPKIERKVEFKNEMIITGASEPYPEETAYTQEIISMALAARDERLSKPKESSSTGTKKPAASGRKMAW